VLDGRAEAGAAQANALVIRAHGQLAVERRPIRNNLASQPLPLSAHSRLPDSMLRVFRYAQGIAGGERCILVV
jgi:hypothetical protein